MFNIVYFMSNSIFKRFKKKEEPVIEEKPSIWEDRIFWVSTLQKIAFPVLNNLSKGSLRKTMPFESNTSEDKKWKGKATIYCPKDDGSEKDEWTRKNFARWTNAFEDSNPGYKWDWDEKKLKGKK